MHYDYVVTLKRENARKIDLVSFLLLIFSVLSFSYVQIHLGLNNFLVIKQGLNGFLMIAAGILLFGVLLNFYYLRKGNELRFRYWLLFAGLPWLAMPFFPWMIILFILFAFLEAQAKYPLEIGFHNEGVVINSLFNQKFSWSSLQSVILKDGLLTLDFINNKLIQKEVLDDDDPDAPEDEFNEYCRSKLVNLP
jgi:hypothetical protein